jgi:hypothetical protein
MAGSGRLNARLRKLEQNVITVGCPECGHRRVYATLHVSRQLVDGTVVSEGPEPSPCGRCGEVPEQVIHVVEVVVNDRADLTRLPG